MEIALLLSFTLTIFMASNIRGAAIEAPLDVITLDDLSQSDREYLLYLQRQAVREKRSEDPLSLLKSKLASGLKSKLSGIASASSHLSSSKGHHYHQHPPEGFDFWDLQKSILNTLLQAVKAITGGITAIKGHLIKGGGYLISAKGKLISAKGEAITNIGKHIASSALLSPRPSHHSAPSAPEHEYGHPSSGGYSAPSGHGEEYHHDHGSPPSDYSDHKYPPSYEAYKDHLSHGAHHGILILKKIPKGHGDSHNGNDGSHNQPPDAHAPDSTPEEPSVPPFTFLPDIKSILSASSVKGHEDEDAPPSAPPSPSAPSHSDYSSDNENSHYHDDHAHNNYNHYDAPSSVHHDESSHYNVHSSGPSPTDYEVPPSATSYGTPFGASETINSGYIKNYDHLQIGHSSHDPQPTMYLPPEHTQLPNIEAYDPLGLPNSHPSPLTVSLMNGSPSRYPQNVKGFEHFPKYAVDLPHNYDTQVSLSHSYARGDHNGYSAKHSQSYRDSATTSSEQRIVLPSQKSLKDPTYLHKFAMYLVKNPSLLKKYVSAYSVLQRIQSSHTRSVSRKKRPQNNDPVRSFAYHLGRYGPMRI